MIADEKWYINASLLLTIVLFVSQDLNTRLKNIINGAPNVLFMKGSPQEPRCGLYLAFFVLIFREFTFFFFLLSTH